jgi:hypothetical protein
MSRPKPAAPNHALQQTAAAVTGSLLPDVNKAAAAELYC